VRPLRVHFGRQKSPMSLRTFSSARPDSAA
jgi:hypothetical protein